MPPDENEGLNLALDILKTKLRELEEVAWKCVTDFELEHFEVVVICAVYDIFWEEFIDGLNPRAAAAAAKLRKKGLTPTSTLITTRGGLASYLTEIQVDIHIPNVKPDKDKVWLLILHSKGHTWLQLSATPPQKLDS